MTTPDPMDTVAMDSVPMDGPAAVRAVPYSPPSPTGWKSTGVRRGPDPSFTTSIRRKGLG